jgi:RNA polymerase sigma factor (TIGR02999 family)
MADVNALLPAAPSGDRQSQNDLFRVVEPELRKVARHWLRRYSAQDRVQVEDLVDRAFLILMTMESLVWRDPAQFYSSASRTIMFLLVDLLRDQDRHSNRFPEEADKHAIIDAPRQRPSGPSDESLVTLERVLDDLECDLSSTHREVIELEYFGNSTLDEIAEILSIQRSVVDRKLKVAQTYLHERLESRFPEFAAIAGGIDKAASGVRPNGGDWSEELNERRIELIDRDIQGNITAGERSELAKLQREAVAYRDRVAPLPIEGARRLHKQLLEMKRERSDLPGWCRFGKIG